MAAKLYHIFFNKLIEVIKMKNKIILNHGYSLGCLRSVLMIVFVFLVLSASLFAQAQDAKSDASTNSSTSSEPSSALSSGQDSTAVKMIDSMIVQKQQSIQSFNQQGLQYDSEELLAKQEIDARQKRLEVIRDSKNQLAGAITILQEDIKMLKEKKKKIIDTK